MYKEGDSIIIKGKFICDFKSSSGGIIEISDLEKEFNLFIPGSNVINTNLVIDSKKITTINDWLANNESGKGEARKQLLKLNVKGRDFIKSFMPGFIESASGKKIESKRLTKEMSISLKRLKDKGMYDGEVISSYAALLKRPYAILVKAIFEAERINGNCTNHLFPKLFSNGVSHDTMFIEFIASNVQVGKEGVYFFSIDDKDPIYVGKSSTGKDKLGFKVEYDGYRHQGLAKLFPNNNSTRGRINTKIAEKLEQAINEGREPNIKWYNIPIENTNVDEIVDKLEKKGISFSCTFNKKNPKLDFLETLLMSMITKEKWNSNEGGFYDLIKII